MDFDKLRELAFRHRGWKLRRKERASLLARVSRHTGEYV